MVRIVIYCALLVTAAATLLDMNEDQWRAKCDTPELSWLKTYMRWAKQERSKGIPAAGVKYLVWSCDLPPGKMLPHPFCYGLSDRLRGILMALRMAVASKRVLLVHQTLPAAMQEFLVPHLIDWSVQSTELPAFQERVVYTNNMRWVNKMTSPVTIHEVVNAVACAKSLAAKTLNSSKLVLITDNIELRQLVSAKQFLPDLVMADLAVMARATCLIHNLSGFYKTAVLWSGTSCTHSLQLGMVLVSIVSAV
ncbi:hypothetical protein V8C86DRAFT_2440914 [Haematococcus lacustris]